MSAEFKDGDVVHYKSERPNRWCREGVAIANERRDGIILVDTFWASMGDAHVLTPDEAKTAELQFNLSDYREVGHEWIEYHPDDRQTVPSQHGLQIRRLVRNGAQPNDDTRMQNARDKVEQAEKAVESAQRSLAWARQELERVSTRAGSAS